MSLKQQIEDMPHEKQIAWGLRVFITIAVMGAGTVSWGALTKLDRIAETQAAQTVQLNRLLIDDSRRAGRMDDLHELYYLLRDRIQALELRFDQQVQRSAPPVER